MRKHKKLEEWHEGATTTVIEKSRLDQSALSVKTPSTPAVRRMRVALELACHRVLYRRLVFTARAPKNNKS